MPYKNKEDAARYRSQYRKTHKEKEAYWSRWGSITWKYGMSKEEFDDILLFQDNKCKICGEEFVKTPCVDHNHITGDIRGLLCKTCNMRVGWVENVMYEKVLKYIREN